jgi:glycosyltransferase involved in cell wall biosynthesis
LLLRGHEVAVLPMMERIWGTKVPWGITPEREVIVFPTMTIPAQKTFGSDWVRIRKTIWTHGAPVSAAARCCFLEGLRSAVKSFAPDLIHVHYTRSDFAALLHLSGVRVPTILTHHTGGVGSDLALFDRILFISQTMRAEVCAASRYPTAQTDVIYLPVADVFRVGEILPSKQRSGFVFVGGISDAKGMDLLSQMHLHAPVMKNQCLRIIGSGEQEAQYRKAFSAGGVDIVFEGRLPAEEVRQRVSAAKFLLIPSRLEGFSVAIMEALACGTPVIGWAPQVRELEARWGMRVGIPFDARTSDALALETAVALGLEEDARGVFDYEAIARRARDEFSWERFGGELVRTYAEVLGLP